MHSLPEGSLWCSVLCWSRGGTGSWAEASCWVCVSPRRWTGLRSGPLESGGPAQCCWGSHRERSSCRSCCSRPNKQRQLHTCRATCDNNVNKTHRKEFMCIEAFVISKFFPIRKHLEWVWIPKGLTDLLLLPLWLIWLFASVSCLCKTQDSRLSFILADVPFILWTDSVHFLGGTKCLCQAFFPFLLLVGHNQHHCMYGTGTMVLCVYSTLLEHRTWIQVQSHLHWYDHWHGSHAEEWQFETNPYHLVLTSLWVVNDQLHTSYCYNYSVELLKSPFFWWRYHGGPYTLMGYLKWSLPTV